MKKARVSATPSADEGLDDDAEEEDEVVSSFSAKLTKFKKSPKKQSSCYEHSSSLSIFDCSRIAHIARKSRSEDDDFIVPSDEPLSDEEPARSSSRSSGRSSRLSMITSDEDDNDEAPAKSSNKSAKQKRQRPPLKKASVSNSNANANSFLTAAEQREQDKQIEKKSQEDSFAFLIDPRDVSRLSVLFHGEVIDESSLHLI